jgi:hypothetical protein
MEEHEDYRSGAKTGNPDPERKHILELVEKVCAHVVVIYQGRIFCRSAARDDSSAQSGGDFHAIGLASALNSFVQIAGC